MKYPFYRFIIRPCVLSTAILTISCLISIQGQDEDRISRTLEKAVREIQSSDGSERRSAAYTLNQLGRDALPALPHIIKGLSDNEDQVWFQCVQLIARLGPDAEEAIPALVDNIRDPGRRYRNQVWYRCTYALGQIGSASIPAARKMLSDNSSFVRSAGSKILGWIGDEAAPLIPELIPLLGDDDSEVRKYTAEALGLIGAEAIAPLVTVLKTREETDYRIAAVNALAQIGEPAAKTAEILASFLKPGEPEPLISASVQALGTYRLDSSRLLQLIEPVIWLPEPAVWEECMAAILTSRDRGASITDWLEVVLQSDDTDKVGKGLALSQRLGPVAAPLAASLIGIAASESDNSGPDSHSRMAVEAMVLMGRPAFLPLIIRLAPVDLDSELADRWELSVLRRIGHLCIPDLTQALNSDFPVIRWVALDVIGTRDIETPDIVIRIKELTHDNQAMVRTRSLATLVNLNIPGRELSPIVQRLMNDESLEVRAQAIRSIQSLGDSAGSLTAQIIKSLDSEKSEIRLAGIRSLPDLPSIPDSVPARLVSDFQNVDTGEKFVRLESLSRMGAKAATALPELLSVPPSGDADLSGQWISTISTIGPGDRRVHEVIISSLKDGNAAVRLAACESLETIDLPTERKIELLRPALSDASRAVREAAAGIAAESGSAARPLARELFDLLNDPQDAAFAIDALRRVQIEEPDYYIESIASSEASVRLFAAEALSRLGKDAEKALPVLRRISENDDYEPVRRAARLAIRQIRRDD